MNRTVFYAGLAFWLALGVQASAWAAARDFASPAAATASATSTTEASLAPRRENVAMLGIGMMLWGLVNGDGMMGQGKKDGAGHGGHGEAQKGHDGRTEGNEPRAPEGNTPPPASPEAAQGAPQ